jgi:hypothetical protein
VFVTICAARGGAVVKRRGIVEDPTDSFNALTTSIKEDISALNSRLAELEVRALRTPSCSWCMECAVQAA